MFFKVCGPRAQAFQGANRGTSTPSLSPRSHCRSSSRRPKVALEGLQRHCSQLHPPHPPQSPHVPGLRNIISNIMKVVLMRKMRLGQSSTHCQKRLSWRNILRHTHQRQPDQVTATSLGQQQGQLHSGSMPAMILNRQLISMRQNNTNTKKLTCGGTPAKVAVARQGRRVKNIVVDSQLRSWRSFTRR